MSVRTALVAVAVTAALSASVVSATSLGTFDEVALEGATFPVTHCEATAEPLSATSSSLPLLSQLLSSFTVQFASFSGIDTACDGRVPELVIIGRTSLLSTTETVLATVPVAALDVAGGADQILATVATTVPALSVVTEVRVAYAPS